MSIEDNKQEIDPFYQKMFDECYNTGVEQCIRIVVDEPVDIDLDALEELGIIPSLALPFISKTIRGYQIKVKSKLEQLKKSTQ